MNHETLYNNPENDTGEKSQAGDERATDIFPLLEHENIFSRTLKQLDFKKLSIVLVISLLFLIHWAITSELFQAPPDVQESRMLFLAAKEHYESKRHYWDTKLLNFHQSLQREEKYLDDYELLHKIQEATPEIWIAYLINNVGLDIERLNNVTIFLKKSNVNEFTLPSLSLVISKYEHSIWPFQILLSLELEISLHAHLINAEIVRLRRGAQDLALGLAWAYFGTELEPLKKVQLIHVSLSKS